MVIDRFCSVCNEDANYFCRMCSRHYCAEHLCLHLNVAWENNSWTRRNDNENIEIRRGIYSLQFSSEESDEVPCLEKNKDTKITIPTNAKSVATYSIPELEEQLRHYIVQARRIRAELERRSISIESLADSESRRLYSQSKRKPPRRGYARGVSRSIEILCSALRTGTLSLDAILMQMRAPSTKERS
jgi:hypothetical protein